MGENIKILVVEDDELISLETTRLLNSLGFSNVLKCNDGQEAIAMTLEHNPEVILMDIVMPGMSGLEACRHIQEQRPTPVVILSAFIDQAFVKDACHAGASYYLSKPPTMDDLERAILISMARQKDLEKLRQTNQQLTAALSEIKQLRGLIPICSFCHKIRNDDDSWDRLEAYLLEHSDAQLTHSVCPECMEVNYPEITKSEGN